MASNSILLTEDNGSRIELRHTTTRD